MVVPIAIQGTKFLNQLTAVVKYNSKKDVEIDAVFDTARRRFDFSLCIFFKHFYMTTHHKLDLYGQKNSVYLQNAHTNRDQNLNDLHHKRPASSTYKLTWESPSDGGWEGRGQIRCCYVLTVEVAG